MVAECKYFGRYQGLICHYETCYIMRRDKSFEFSELRIFVTVADAETLTSAAQRLGVTQSAVSQAIKQLEDHTGTALVLRNSRPIKLTANGEILRQYAARVLSETQRVMNDLRVASTGKLSQLSVGMIDSFSDSLALQFLSQIKPLVAKVTLQTGLHASLSEALRNRDIDVLITSDHSIENAGINSLALIRDPFLVIAPENHVGKHDTSEAQIAHIANTLPFVHYLSSSRIGRQTDLIARRVGVEFNTHYELDSTQTLMRFVQAEHGWAIISALCMVRYPDLLEGIRVIDLHQGVNARYISQLSRKNEFGNLAEEFAVISRTLFDKEVVPQLARIAPWLPEQAHSIEQFPPI